MPLSVTIIAFNEERNLPRAIKSVSWAEDIMVIDSGSTDGTAELAERLGARLVHNPWPGYGKQKNFAQQNAMHNWVLNLDADEVVTPALRAAIERELEAVGSGSSEAKGFYFPRKTFYLGRWIRHGGWFPNHLVRLADRRHAKWTEPRVHERLVVTGEVKGLTAALEHYSFSGIRDQVLTNLKLSQLGSQDLKDRGLEKVSLARLMFKPLGKFIETYLIKMGILDGLPGLIISINAAYSMFLKYAFIKEEELRRENSDR